MNHEAAVLITNVLVALLSAGGFWAFLEKIPNSRRKKREATTNKMISIIDKIDSDSTKNMETVKELSEILNSVTKNITELYDGQKSCGIKIQNSEELSRAFARDRLNFLSNKYIEQGFIPTEDIISFKLLGKAYIESGGNSETKTKFEHCIETLPVLDKDHVNRS